MTTLEKYRAFKQHMGPEFQVPPKPLRYEITESIRYLSEKLQYFASTNISDDFATTQQQLGDLIVALKTGDYALTPSEIAYNKKYNELERQFKYPDLNG